jgi:hypothetical protein
MRMRRVVIAAGSALAFTGSAQADEASTIASRSINLGAVSGVAYYTVEPSGYHVVATLAHGEAGMPVRFEAVLAPGQTMGLSTPGAASVEPASIEIMREGDELLMRNATMTN